MLSNEVHFERQCIWFKMAVLFGLKTLMNHIQEANLLITCTNTHTNLSKENLSQKQSSESCFWQLVQRCTGRIGWQHRYSDVTRYRELAQAKRRHLPCSAHTNTHPASRSPLCSIPKELGASLMSTRSTWVCDRARRNVSHSHTHAYTHPSHRWPKWDFGL